MSAQYTFAGETAQRITPQVEVSISPLAPAWAVFVGGFLGVIVVVVFKYLLTLNQPTVSPTTSRQPEIGEAVSVGDGAAAAPARAAASPASGKEWWAAPALGMVVVLLSVICFRFTATQFPDLPITVSVKDVYGGFALGLVSHTLSDFFKNALQS